MKPVKYPYRCSRKCSGSLQDKQFERIGGARTFTIDVRIIAATNVILKQAATLQRISGNVREIQNLTEWMVILA